MRRQPELRQSLSPTDTFEELSAASLAARDAYSLMTSLVAPRPIAWVSTCDAEGRPNLAPFSYFQAVCSAPPMVVLAISPRGDGRKDTLANLLETREATINLVSHAQAVPMNLSSADLPHQISEWDTTGLASAPALVVRPRRVAGSVAGLECRLSHAIPLGAGPNGKPSATLVIAEVVHFWVRDGLVERDERGHIRPLDPARLDSIGRLAGEGYTTTRDRFGLRRPH